MVQNIMSTCQLNGGRDESNRLTDLELEFVWLISDCGKKLLIPGILNEILILHDKIPQVLLIFYLLRFNFI